MKLGSSFHEAIARNYTAKAESKQDLPLDEVTDYFSDSFRNGLQQEEVVFDEGETADGLRDVGVGITRAHHTMIAPKVFPMSAETVEQKSEMVVGKDENQFVLTAIVDLVDASNTIREAKTAAKRPSEADIAKHLDLSVYALARRLATREVEAGLALDVAVKVKQPVAISYPTTRTREHLRFTLNRIAHIARSIRAEAYPPNPDWWGCSPKFCGYWNLCVGKGLETVDMGENQNLENQLQESIRHAEEAKQANGAPTSQALEQEEKSVAAAPEKEKPSEGRQPRRRGATPSLFPAG